MTDDKPKTPEELAGSYATAPENQHMLEAPRSNAVLYHAYLDGYRRGKADAERRIWGDLTAGYSLDADNHYAGKTIGNLKQIIFGGGDEW